MLGDVWKNDSDLAALVPFACVFTGRIPTIEESGVKMQATGVMRYVSITDMGGNMTGRSNFSRFSKVTITFHVWVDESSVSLGERIENAIVNAYAEGEWEFDGGCVYDVLDEGRGNKVQANRPEYKQWEIVKVMTFYVESPRRIAA
jgi:hypothetical protein